MFLIGGAGAVFGPLVGAALIETATTPELLAALVGQILGDEAREVAPILPELYERHDGNLRDALRELYDRYAASASGPARRA